jgi:hypothetical protein
MLAAPWNGYQLLSTIITASMNSCIAYVSPSQMSSTARVEAAQVHAVLSDMGRVHRI